LRGIWCSSSRCLKGDTQPSTPVQEIELGKRVDANTSAYTVQASGVTSELPGHDAKVEIAGNPIMHPQELEAEVPMSAIANQIDNRVSGPSSSSGKTTDVSSLSQAPEGGVVELHPNGKRGVNGRGFLPSSEEEALVSPASPTADTSTSLRMRRSGEMPNITVGSPTETTSTWTPRTPIGHDSRVDERWGEEGL
jgi:hypothetical protein